MGLIFAVLPICVVKNAILKKLRIVFRASGNSGFLIPFLIKVIKNFGLANPKKKEPPNR